MSIALFDFILNTFIIPAPIIAKPQYQLYNGPEWDGYRIGDFLKYKKMQDKSYVSKYPGSIAEKYLEINKGEFKNNNTQSILKALEETCNEEDSGHVVIHLRIGDVTDRYLRKYGRACTRKRYVSPEKYKRIGEEIKKRGINRNKKIKIIAGIHLKKVDGHQINVQDSIDYINEVKKQLDLGDIEVVSGSPDRDMCMASNAALFIPSKGGFSELAAHMTRSKGGDVIPINEL